MITLFLLASIILIKCEDNNKIDEQITKLKYENIISKLKTNNFSKIVFLTGAGASTSAGIPDFRSENGLYKQLKDKYNLSFPEDVFSLDYFYKNPKYFYEYSYNFLKNDYKPTLFHKFMGFINSKHLLKYIFTQNIDGLDLKVGIERDKIIFAHGNFEEAQCPRCGKEIDNNLYKKHIESKEILYCDKCGSPCKSKIVFYGEYLPHYFYEKRKEIYEADLIIICGTTLLVSPFNELPYGYVNNETYRMVINDYMVGRRTNDAMFGVCLQGRCFEYEKEDSKDVFLKGKCDDVAMNIVKDAGWEKEFKDFIDKLKNK